MVLPEQVHVRKQWVQQIVVVREKAAFPYIKAFVLRALQAGEEERKKTKEELRALRAAR